MYVVFTFAELLMGAKRSTRKPPIDANDLWIVCHALADDCTLVTNNVREFERVAGLRLENWPENPGAPPVWYAFYSRLRGTGGSYR